MWQQASNVRDHEKKKGERDNSCLTSLALKARGIMSSFGWTAALRGHRLSFERVFQLGYVRTTCTRSELKIPLNSSVHYNYFYDYSNLCILF